MFICIYNLLFDTCAEHEFNITNYKLDVKEICLPNCSFKCKEMLRWNTTIVKYVLCFSFSKGGTEKNVINYKIF